MPSRKIAEKKEFFRRAIRPLSSREKAVFVARKGRFHATSRKERFRAAIRLLSRAVAVAAPLWLVAATVEVAAATIDGPIAPVEVSAATVESPIAPVESPIVAAPTDTVGTDTAAFWEGEHRLEGVEVVRRRSGIVRMGGAVDGTLITKDELFRAACCNLGESFVNNPSVDVNYSDAATGARQIRLLGLSGTYVQLLTENIPAFRGAAAPFALSYVPGTWMNSIQVSKGNASVKNGYESITGQINVEYLKPDDTEGAVGNVYGDTQRRLEVNADANIRLTSALSTAFLAHYENRWGHHDGDGDGFQDMPTVLQYNVQSRWKYAAGRHIVQWGAAVLDEHRAAGQTSHAEHASTPYRIDIDTRRYEAYLKSAYVLNAERGASVALIATASMHRQDALYGADVYAVNEKNAYGQLLYEGDVAEHHNIAAGASIVHDYIGQHVAGVALYDDATGIYTLSGDEGVVRLTEEETVVGAYAQYTYDRDGVVTAMAGVRVDHSSVYGTFVTPRLHLKWQPCDVVGVRLSAGKGYRSPHALAEHNNLLASGRQLVVGTPQQEEAWNYGASVSLTIPVGRRTLRVGGEYYYTNFACRTDVDYSTPYVVRIGTVSGRSYSHTIQVDASCELLSGLDVTAAFRRNIVRSTYGGVRCEQPLTSRYKGLFTASYALPPGLWQIDVTLQLNGGGRMPEPYTTADGTPSWPARYAGYEQLSAQLTRRFRHCSVYVGGENLTSRRQRTLVYGADDPWSTSFEPTMVWGPVHGAMAYVGVRVNIGRL